MTSFGSLLHEARAVKGWDVAMLANHIGRESDDIALYEADLRLPQPKTVAMIEVALGLETGILMDARQQQIDRKRLGRSAHHMLSYPGSRKLSEDEEESILGIITEILGERSGGDSVQTSAQQ